MAFRRGTFELGLRRFAKALRLVLDEGRIEQLRQMLAERMDFGPRSLGLDGAGGFFGGGHKTNMGRVQRWGKGWNAPAGIRLNLGLGGACSIDNQSEPKR